MPDREKVIKGLENSLTNQGCGYMDGVGELYAVSGEDLQNAIAMLKEQEPRVMAPTEVYTADFVYVEFDGVITPALRTSKEREGHRESYFATQQLGGEWMRWDDYGITWRCWTSKPTDKQRKAAKWE